MNRIQMSSSFVFWRHRKVGGFVCFEQQKMAEFFEEMNRILRRFVRLAQLIWTRRTIRATKNKMTGKFPSKVSHSSRPEQWRVAAFRNKLVTGSNWAQKKVYRVLREVSNGACSINSSSESERQNRFTQQLVLRGKWRNKSTKLWRLRRKMALASTFVDETGIGTSVSAGWSVATCRRVLLLGRKRTARSGCWSGAGSSGWKSLARPTTVAWSSRIPTPLCPVRPLRSGGAVYRFWRPCHLSAKKFVNEALNSSLSQVNSNFELIQRRQCHKTWADSKFAKMANVICITNRSDANEHRPLNAKVAGFAEKEDHRHGRPATAAAQLTSDGRTRKAPRGEYIFILVESRGFQSMNGPRLASSSSDVDSNEQIRKWEATVSANFHWKKWGKR